MGILQRQLIPKAQSSPGAEAALVLQVWVSGAPWDHGQQTPKLHRELPCTGLEAVGTIGAPECYTGGS